MALMSVWLIVLMMVLVMVLVMVAVMDNQRYLEDRSVEGQESELWNDIPLS